MTTWIFSQDALKKTKKHTNPRVFHAIEINDRPSQDIFKTNAVFGDDIAGL